ncbi:MAG TPA: hypothetical protein VGM62_05840, partial [Chthoniobacterales bacterium]
TPAHPGASFVPERHREPPKKHTISAAKTEKLPELTTFRALSRQVYGVEATGEYIREAIVFCSMMLVAAWPLAVTLNQLGTMMISPPNALW